ncbi:MAG: phenylacetate--CoA ligase family protein [Thermoguttaceae bacterium]
MFDFIAPFSRHIVAPIWAKWERSDYLKHYRKFLKTQYDSPETIRSRQTAQMKAILKHAFQTSPFWKNRFNEFGCVPEQIESLEDLPKLPLLTKNDLRQHGNEMISSHFSDLTRLTRAKTSGSTGVPVVVYSNEASDQFKRGAVLRSDEWTGWKLGERIAAIWGNPQIRSDWKGRLRNTFLDRYYVFLDTLKMNEQAMHQFAAILSKKQPGLLFGHAHSLYLFALFLRHKSSQTIIRPHGILSTCMVLHDHERKVIENTFQCPVTNRYGCEEVSLIASECDAHTGLHINSDCLYLELIDAEGNPVPPNTPGRIVLTDLCNLAMPMIRYEVGDSASWADHNCSCGRNLPLLNRIEGRIADYVITENGEYISGISLTENFACLLEGVAQFQIVQEGINQFTFNFVKGDDFSEKTLHQLDSLVKARFGENTKYEIIFMDSIPKEASGKYRFCISKVKHE